MATFSDITEHMRLNRRHCANCEKRLIRKPREILCAWRRRKYCDQSCSNRHCHTEAVPVRFFRHVNVTPGLGPSGTCHEWTGCRDKRGYGKTNAYGETLAHRVAWVLANGQGAGDLFVCHTCDNPSCVNPGHLFLGTQADNMADMAMKGRGAPPKRDTHHNAKLSYAQIGAIIADTRRGEDVARDFGITKGYANQLRRKHKLGAA